MIEICAIASGSNGNCYYIGNETDAVIIDAGISCKQIISRMHERKLDPLKIKAAFVTHEHGDHMRGVRGVAKRLQIPIYLTAKTMNGAYKNMRPDLATFFKPGDQITIGKFTIHSFLKNHDASEPCSFRVEYEGINVGVFTDIGAPCSRVKNHIKECDALFLEANYDETMLREGRYPLFLKQRVASQNGHLSNEQALELVKNYGSPHLQFLLLSHISKENNTPAIALEAFHSLSKRMNIKATSRMEASEVFRLNNKLGQMSLGF